jgi:hypothetical protein
VNKLMLCAGMTKRDGWLTLDSDPESQADFIATIPPLPEQILSEKWDEIEWIHGIGSLYTWEAKEVIRQIRAVLNPDGVLILEQPSLGAVAQEILRDPSKAWWMFGDPTHRNPSMMNRWCYSPASLTEMLKEYGFTRVSVSDAQHHGRSPRDFRVEARP